MKRNRKYIMRKRAQKFAERLLSQNSFWKEIEGKPFSRFKEITTPDYNIKIIGNIFEDSNEIFIVKNKD